MMAVVSALIRMPSGELWRRQGSTVAMSRGCRGGCRERAGVGVRTEYVVKGGFRLPA